MVDHADIRAGACVCLKHLGNNDVGGAHHLACPGVPARGARNNRPLGFTLARLVVVWGPDRRDG